MDTARTAPRSGLVLDGRDFLMLLALPTLIGLMQVDRLDPTTVRGQHLGTPMTVSWFLGLNVWLLGVVRQNRSRFRVRTLAGLVAVVALFFGAWRAFGPPIPTMAAAGATSAAMLLASRNTADAEAVPFRGRACRAIMTAGGLLMLAHICRVFGLLALVSIGLVDRPGVPS